MSIFPTIKNLLDENKGKIIEIESYLSENFNPSNNFQFLSNNNSKKHKSINEIKIEELEIPFNTDINGVFNNFFHSGVLRPYENKRIEENFRKYFFHKNSKKLYKYLFLIVLLTKFPKITNQLLENSSKLRKKISKKYSQIFILMQKPKDEYVNLLIFSLGYLIHMQLFINFPQNRHFFKIRFVFDVYLTIIYEIHGLFVSDFYIQTMIEKIFSTKFLDYEKIYGILTEKKPHLDHKESNCDFLSYNNNSFYRQKSTMTGNYASNFQKNSPQATRILEGIDVFGNELTTKLRLEKRLYKPTEISVQKTKNNDDKNDDSKNKDNIKKRSASLHEEPTLKRLKFNCVQVSPAISSVLDLTSMTLPFKKNKLINYSLDKLYNQRINYKTVLDEYNKEKNEITKEIRTKSLHEGKNLDVYGNIRVHYDEKAKKFPKLFRDMEYLYAVLKKHDDKFSNLNSSRLLLAENKQRTFLIENQKIINEMQEEEKQKIFIQKKFAEKLGESELQNNLNKFSKSTRKLMINEGKNIEEKDKNLIVNNNKNDKRMIVASIIEKGRIQYIKDNELEPQKAQPFFMLGKNADNTIKEEKGKLRRYIKQYKNLIKDDDYENNISEITNKLDKIKE